MSRPLTAEEAGAIAAAAGLALKAEDAARLARAISPGLAAFAPIAGTLPLDLEPATFLKVQRPAEPVPDQEDPQ
ncbi:hypothetical protein ABLE93_01795 [Xanthobacter sp. KR7-65]|uniref:hypothetical protein n=1 Tax=Xanthobacter sp. KR7-65 TaxID=3156612 RepID=UPI0032B4FE04